MNNIKVVLANVKKVSLEKVRLYKDSLPYIYELIVPDSYSQESVERILDFLQSKTTTA